MYAGLKMGGRIFDIPLVFGMRKCRHEETMQKRFLLEVINISFPA